MTITRRSRIAKGAKPAYWGRQYFVYEQVVRDLIAVTYPRPTNFVSMNYMMASLEDHPELAQRFAPYHTRPQTIRQIIGTVVRWKMDGEPWSANHQNTTYHVPAVGGEV